MPPPEPGDPLVTRRTSCCKRPPTVDEEEETRQKRFRSEPVPRRLRVPDRSVRVTWLRTNVKIPVFQNIVESPVCRKLMCTLKIEIVPDR